MNMQSTQRQIILASTSPRRYQLLKQLGLQFDTVASDFEEWLDATKTPEEMAGTLGLGKALAVAEKYPEAIVIGSDTIVTVEGRQLGKAVDIDEARAMWRLITSAANTIATSVAVVCRAENYEKVMCDNAFVTFKPYDEQSVEAYLATGDWHDKAAAYAIQHPLVRTTIAKIGGNTETIVGLPTGLVQKMLSDFT